MLRQNTFRAIESDVWVQPYKGAQSYPLSKLGCRQLHRTEQIMMRSCISVGTSDLICQILPDSPACLQVYEFHKGIRCKRVSRLKGKQACRLMKSASISTRLRFAHTHTHTLWTIADTMEHLVFACHWRLMGLKFLAQSPPDFPPKTLLLRTKPGGLSFHGCCWEAC